MKINVKINVMVCDSSGNAMPTQSASITQTFRKFTDVKDICADGVRLHSSIPSNINLVCSICDSYGIHFRRIDDWNVRVALKESGNGFGVYFA